jgi:hypothetical protein
MFLTLKEIRFVRNVEIFFQCTTMDVVFFVDASWNFGTLQYVMITVRHRGPDECSSLGSEVNRPGSTAHSIT